MCIQRSVGISRRAITTAAVLSILVGSTDGFSRCHQEILKQNSVTLTTRNDRSNLLLSKSTTTRQTLVLSMASNDSNKGVYSRPSAAIERGSGFFIPGLEGPRVRLLFGVVVLVFTVLNHVLLSSNLPTVAFAERVAVIYAVLLLLQAAIEFGKEEKGYVVTLDTSPAADESVSASPSYSQTWSPASIRMSEAEKERVQWAAASYVALTPATHMLLLNRNDGVMYRLGVTPPCMDSSKEKVGTQAAFAALDKTSSGRVSLPPTHPTATALNSEEKHGRCIVLQRIDDDTCWMMTSKQLLQAFTKEDLKWLGQLAIHIADNP